MEPASKSLSLSSDALAPCRPHWPAILLTLFIFAAFSLFFAIKSTGFLESDACTHYLFSRFAFTTPHYLVDIWGRPFCTILYSLPAILGGRLAVRITSLLIALLTGAVVYRIAREQKYRWPELALMFTFAQPILFLHSFSELTELPFALLIALAFWAYQRRQFALMAILVGLGSLCRPEAFGFILLAIPALLLHRRFYWLPILFLPLFAWSFLGCLIDGFPPNRPWFLWLISNWPYESQSLYGSGQALHYLEFLPAIVSPFLFPFLWIGAIRNFVKGALFKDHLRRCQFLSAAIPLLVFFTHSLLWYFGKFSGGELRYLLVVAPFWALLTAKGWDWTFTRLHLPRPLLCAAAASLLPLVANLCYPVLPLKSGPDAIISQKIAHDYLQSPRLRSLYPRIMSSHPAIYYYVDISPIDPNRTACWGKNNVLHPSDGTMLIWEESSASFNADRRLIVTPEDLRQGGWIPYKSYGQWQTFLSPRTITPTP